MSKLLKALSDSVGKSLPFQTKESISDIKVTIPNNMNMQFYRFEEIRNVIAGSMTFMTLIMMTNPVGWIAYSCIGVASLIAGYFTNDIMNSRNKEQAINSLGILLSNTVRRAQLQAIQQFEKMANDYDKGFRESLHKATAEIQDDIKSKIKAIAEQRQRSKEESAERIKQINQLVRKSNDFITNLGRITGTNSVKKNDINFG
jgi:hypothetical protein